MRLEYVNKWPNALSDDDDGGGGGGDISEAESSVTHLLHIQNGD
jgi:hypothetical protein